MPDTILNARKAEEDKSDKAPTSCLRRRGMVSPGAYSNSGPLSRWSHTTISSFVVLFSSCLQCFPASGSFPMESVLHIRWPKYWSFSLSISPSDEYSELISFRMEWLDLIQGTLKSLLQHHSSKASILQCSAFFLVQLSHSYMTTGKTIALTRWTFVGKVMSLLFNMLSRLVITFLPRSKRLLISWLQSPSAVILEPKKSLSPFPLFPHLLALKWWEWMPWSSLLWTLSFKPGFSHSSFPFIKRLFSSSSLSAIRVVSPLYLRLLIFLPVILIPACASSSPAFHMMYSAYKLNKQGDSIQPWRTPFPIWNQSVVTCPYNCCFLTCIQVSQEAGQVVWYSHLSQNFPQFIVIHTVKGFGIVDKAEMDVFLELSCFLNDPVDVGNLISGSSAFSKTSLNIWKFTVHILLKHGLTVWITASDPITSAEELMLLKFWESLGLQGDPNSPFWRRSALGFLWKEWC